MKVILHKSLAGMSMIFVILSITPIGVYAADNQQDFDAVKQRVNALQATDPSLPGGVTEQKGRVGTILSRLFDADGKIGNIFLKILGTRSNNQLMKWDAGAGQLVGTQMYNNGDSFSIGTNSSAAGLTIRTDNAAYPNQLRLENDLATTNKAWRIRIPGQSAGSRDGGLEFVTGSAQPLMVLSSSGNLGISNSNPTEKLHVIGNGKFTGTVSGATPTEASNFTTKSYVDTALLGAGGGKFVDGTDSDDAVYTAGNVGIGIVNPEEKLHVDGRVLVEPGGGFYWNSPADDVQRTIIGTGLNTGNIYDINIGYNTGLQGDIKFTGGGGEYAIIQRGTGNFGIGIDNPGEKLDVVGNGQFSGTVSAANPVAATDLTTKSYVDGAITAGVAGAGDDLGNHTATENIQLDGNWLSNDGGNEGIRIADNGNVGIGIDNPVQKFDIASGFIELDDTYGIRSSGQWVVGRKTANEVRLGTDDVTDYTSLYAGAAERLRINTNGRVGIGTITPSVALEVDGNIISDDPTENNHVATKVYVDNAITVASNNDINALSDAKTTATSLYLGTDVGDIATGVSNTAIGQYSLQANTGGNNNTAIGRAALANNTTGIQNTAIGSTALRDNTTASYSTAVGVAALAQNTTGSYNMAVGRYALYDNTTGKINVAIGASALQNNTTGNYNIGIGFEALGANTTRGNQVAIGYVSLRNNTTGYANVAVGSNALQSNTIGNSNVAVGQSSLQDNTTGSNNTALGRATLSNNTTGSYNAALGSLALRDNTTGSFNVANGGLSLLQNTTGTANIGVGYNALYSNTTGNNNTGIGYVTLSNNTTGSNNVGLGSYSLERNTTGAANTALGYHNLRYNTTGIYNTAVGYAALDANTTANNNTALGYYALGASTTGAQNTAVGAATLDSVTTGFRNTAIGYNALGGVTTGENNSAIGGLAGDNITTGSKNIILGYNVDAPSATASNQLNIGNTIYGDLANGTVGIGVINPDQGLDVAGNIEATGTVYAGASVYVQGTSARHWFGSNSDGRLFLGAGRNSDNTKNSINLYNESCVGGCNVPAINLYADTTAVLGNMSVTGNATILGTASAATPTASNHLTTKSYVDSAISTGGADNLGNHTATQNLNMNTRGINFSYAASTPATGPSIRWSNGTQANTLGFYVNGGINYQGNSANPDFKVRTPTTDGTLGTIRFQVEGDTGNVGIGTSVPSEKLDLNGDIKIRGTNRLHFTNTSDRVYVGAPGSDLFAIGTAGTERLRINAGGNVGIGTSNPNEFLTIQSGTLGNQSKISIGDTTDRLKIGFSTSGLESGINASQIIDTGSVLNIASRSNNPSSIAFSTRNSSGGPIFSEKMRIDGNGNIGVGTDSPTEKLHVLGNAKFTGTVEGVSPVNNNHLTTKSYVDTLVSQGVSWKAPVDTSASTTYGACNASKEGWATYNKSDDIIYLCNALAWVSIGSSASIPYATTTTPGRVQIAGDIEGTWNSIQLKTNSVGASELAGNVVSGVHIVDDTITAADIGTSAVRTQEILDSTITTNDILNNTLTENDISDSFKARDSNLLDGVDGSNFLRSNVDDTLLGKLSVGSDSSRRAGMYGLYSSIKIGHIWSIGTAYQISQDGSTFGNLYGLAYKHTNNPTGGTMAGGHQTIHTENGIPRAAMGTNGLWTNSSVVFGADATQRFLGDNSSAIYADSNHSTLTRMIFRDKEDTIYGTVYGADNGASFGLLDGDSTWGIQMVKDNYTRFAINNSEKMRINSNGNVGIGVNNPLQKLHIGNTGAVPTYISVGDNTNQRLKLGYSHTSGFTDNNIAAQILTDSSGNLNLSSRTNNPSGVNFYTNSGTAAVYRMGIKSNGDVGIGTSSPTEKLDVLGNARFTGTVAGANPTAASHLTTKAYVDSAVSSAGGSFIQVGSSGDQLQDGTIDSTEIEDNSLNEDDISDSFVARNANLLDGFNSGYGATLNTIPIRDGAADITARLFRSTFAEQTSVPAATADIAFRNNNTTDNYTRFMSLAAAKSYLGITPNTDSQTLGISGNTLSISGGNSVTLPNFTNTDTQDLSLNTTTDVVSLVNGGTIDLTYLRNTDTQNLSLNATSDVLSLTNGGTVDFTYLRDGDIITDGTVDGTEIEDNTLTASDLATNSVGNDEMIDNPTFDNVTANSFTYSDKRLKKNFHSLDDVSSILNLKTYRFDWKKNDISDLGFIAQEVQEVYPEFVRENEDGYLTVDYSRMIVPLLEVTKQQQTEIDELKAIVKQLQAQ